MPKQLDEFLKVSFEKLNVILRKEKIKNKEQNLDNYGENRI